ncbi:MAG: hypothetical protein C0173_06430 [Desulfurella sp.]|jgi:hypothetical protein|uniref:hypothetical protein n=1 Tax=Desulfurella sp. TaxID=1962857 RepID=UPI000CACCB53|nr:hypothetical protein [Desulfurella sp.]PMP88875.1 MAG: hypothetical protein C0173_06430 [Desulfurella sp.]
MLKKIIVKIFLHVFAKSVIFLSKRDKSFQQELNQLKDGFVIKLGVWNKPELSVSIIKNKDHFNKAKTSEKPNLEVYFKNINAAFRCLSALDGLEEAFAKKRMFVVGLISNALIFTRLSMIVEQYLFGYLICKRIMKKPPKINLLLKIKLYIYIALKGLYA